jgi:hypothetical protein
MPPKGNLPLTCRIKLSGKKDRERGNKIPFLCPFLYGMERNLEVVLTF